MIQGADFDQAFGPVAKAPWPSAVPQCSAPACFGASYPPVTPAGQVGPFFVNSYFLRPDRARELGGPVPVRSDMCQ